MFHLGWRVERWSMGQVRAGKLMNHNQLMTTNTQNETPGEMEEYLIMSSERDNDYVLRR